MEPNTTPPPTEPPPKMRSQEATDNPDQALFGPYLVLGSVWLAMAGDGIVTYEVLCGFAEKSISAVLETCLSFTFCVLIALARQGPTV